MIIKTANVVLTYNTLDMKRIRSLSCCERDPCIKICEGADQGRIYEIRGKSIRQAVLMGSWCCKIDLLGKRQVGTNVRNGVSE